MLLMCVLMTCLSLSTPGGGDPNQVSSRPEVNGVAGVAKPTDARGPASKGEQAEAPSDTDKRRFHWTEGIPWAISLALLLVAAAGFGFGLHQYRQRRANAEIKKAAELKVEESFRQAQRRQTSQTAEDQYKSILTKELGTIQVLGTHEIANVPVDLLETFVSLDISATSQADCAGEPDRRLTAEQGLHGLTPESVAKRAFKEGRMLLVLGDAGSGKTTLVKYYAMLCLKEDRHKELGFSEPPLPIYFPLRDIDFQDATPRLLHDCLSKWATKHYRDISREVFLDWLNNRRTLVLLDGLDEISDLEKRRRVCDWIDDTARGLDKACLVVTSRWTGYRKLDQIQLGFEHIVADIKEFSSEQQAQFLRKWFVAAYRKETRNEAAPVAQWDQTQSQRGLDRAQTIIDFLALDKNKGVRELVGVPMLLQIVAIIWKEHEDLPQGRAELYEAALKYLLDYRERHRHLTPLLKANQALRVLSPVSLWMQEILASDQVQKADLHLRMQPIIQTMDDKLTSERYCEYLRDRAAVLADYGEDSYVFRHKSFREYLAGGELINACKDPKRLRQVAKHLGDDWWEEPLRFFMGEVDDKLFDGFMNAVFRSDVSKELDQKTYNLLLTLVSEASQRRVDSLVRCLNDKRLHDNKKRYIVDCLKTIGSSEALAAVERFAQATQGGAAAAAAQEIAAQRRAVAEPVAKSSAITAVFRDLPPSFRNPYELNAEYIRIPGRSFKYPVTKKTETVADLYFAKYPVTNQRYRLFVNYLTDSKAKLGEMLPLGSFSKAAIALAAKEKGFKEYLDSDPDRWAGKLKSNYDEEKRFKGDDQPVVGVSWFDASLYCLWLSMLEAAGQGVAVEKLGRVYRLPNEVEWVWAAFGRAPDGGLREYPWLAEKGKASDKLANYHQNVGATTPVGRYPEGATPEGLMDMAGNVWEWMENWYDKDRDARSLRGGSWGSDGNSLRCSGRAGYSPVVRGGSVGFRVVCSQPS